MTDSLPIDMVFHRVGRIKKASGTHNATVRNKMKRMLTALYEDGRDDLLRAIVENKVSLLQVYGAYQRKELDKLPTASATVPLIPAWEAWVKQKDCSDEHRRSLRQSLRHLRAASGNTVHELPVLVERAHERLRTYPQSFRLLRSACRAFVAETLKRTHPIYASIVAIDPLKPAPKRRRYPLVLAQLRTLAEALGPHGHMAWTLALTGMRPKEYHGAWEVTNDGIHILGTKTRAADRWVPCVFHSTPTIGYWGFLNAMRRLDTPFTPYDLRRTYMNIMEDCEIPRTRRKLYMGHSSGDVSALYEWREVKAFLAEDAAKLRAFVGEVNQGLRIAK